MSEKNDLHNVLWDLVEEIKSKLELLGVPEIAQKRIDQHGFRRSLSSLLSKEGIKLDELIKEFTETDAFQNALSLIERRFGLMHDDARDYTTLFVKNVVKETEEEISPRLLAEKIHLFIDELSGYPVLYRISVWIDGVVLDEDTSCELSDDTIIRPDRSSMFGANIISSVVGNIEDARLKLRMILSILQLFRLSSAYVFEGDIAPVSFFKESEGINPPWIFYLYSYDIDSSNKDDLIAFYQKIFPSVRRAYQVPKKQYLQIALDRYDEALTRPRLFEQRISYAISALEALLLTPKEHEGLSRRLAQRLSMLLREFDYNPLEVFETTLRAYGIRSRYIHGGNIEEKADLAHTCASILEFVRACLLVLLQLIDSDKNKVVMIADKAMIDDESLKKLKEMLETVSVKREKYTDDDENFS